MEFPQMMNKGTFVLVIAAVGIIASMISGPLLASAVSDYFTIKKAKVIVDPDRDRLRANLITHGLIPTDGSEGAFGYGILTSDGDAILVTTTHPGVLDSEDQSYILDPIWHNHFVRLNSVAACGSDPGVTDITWQSPGKVVIDDNKAKVSRIPTDSFDGTHSITGGALEVELGEDVNGAVSFRLSPVFGSGGLEAVCVTDITPAESLVVS
jgi:hypothetical protein